MATMEEIKKLKTGDRIICNGSERVFLILNPYDPDYPVISAKPDNGITWSYCLEKIEIPKKEPKKLGEVTYWQHRHTKIVTTVGSGDGALFQNGIYQQVNIKGNQSFEVEE